MKPKLLNRVLAALLSLALLAGLMPETTLAAGMKDGTASVIVNQSKVGFAGYEWWVIGYNGAGVYSTEGDNTVTLLAANHNFGNSQFGNSNAYAESTLQQTMVSIVNGFSQKEQAVINPRDLSASDGITGNGISGQLLWALSTDEANAINNDTVQSYGNSWWLRSPGYNNRLAADVYDFGLLSTIGGLIEYSIDAVRPAFNLNLESVLFTSNASTTTGKSAVTIGSGLVSMGTPSGTVKFTMRSDSQKLIVNNMENSYAVRAGNNLSFEYRNATTGGNQYVSCVLTDNNGNVKYYGKLANSSNAASDSISVSFTGVDSGIYTLQIFSEEANGPLSTDFCSEPVTTTVEVPHEHSWATTWSSNEAHHWHECTTANCPISENSQKGGYAAHTYDEQVISDTYLASSATCEESATYYYSCACGAKGIETFISGQATGHNWGNWQSNGNGTHTRTCQNQNCTAKDTGNCTGGTATCTAKAVCKICGSAYGGLGKHALTYTQAQTGTCTTDGNAEYWRCEACGTYFRDAAGTTEIALSDIAIRATGHSYTDGKCTVCGAIDSGFQPAIIAGAGSTWKKGAKDGLSFTSNAGFADFLKVQVDGKDLAASDYEVRAGSTVVTLKASYLQTLSVGKHTLAIISDTGTAATEFTILAAAGTDDIPQTGESGGSTPWIVVLLASGAALAAAAIHRRKRRCETR